MNEGNDKSYSEKITQMINDQIKSVYFKEIEMQILFSHKLERLIDSSEYTKIDFAYQMGITTQELKIWFKGDYNYTLEDLLNIADILNVKLSVIFDELSN